MISDDFVILRGFDSYPQKVSLALGYMQNDVVSNGYGVTDFDLDHEEP